MPTSDTVVYSEDTVSHRRIDIAAVASKPMANPVDSPREEMDFSIVIVNKDDERLGLTLSDLEVIRDQVAPHVEIVVVDASSGRLEAVRNAHSSVTWIDFESVHAGRRITIAEQRNVGIAISRGEIVIFTDAGCRVNRTWFEALSEPFLQGENVVVGSFQGAGNASSDIYSANQRLVREYVSEAPTLNFAIRRSCLDEIHGFDERFDYGSDVDLCWRLGDIGLKILKVPEAVIYHDFEGGRVQRKRSYRYGAARARLYDTHRRRLRTMPSNDPILIVYPALILTAPLFALRPKMFALWIPLLLRNRGAKPFATFIDHVVYGFGALSYVSRFQGRRPVAKARLAGAEPHVRGYGDA